MCLAAVAQQGIRVPWHVMRGRVGHAARLCSARAELPIWDGGGEDNAIAGPCIAVCHRLQLLD